MRPVAPVVFSADWFAAHQGLLLALLRRPLLGRWFRWVLCIRPHDVGYRGRIVQLLPHAYTVANADGSRTTDFRTHAKYAKRLYYAFRPIWWTLHAWDLAIANPFVPALNAGFDTLTAYPDPASGVTTCDGDVGRVGVDETFATIVAGAGNNASNSNATAKAGYLFASATANQFQYLIRGGYIFDTSAIGTGVVSAGTLSLSPSGKQNGLGDPDVDVVALSPASNNVFVNADYGTIGGTSFGSIAYASTIIGTYSDVTLNASGIAAIAPSGFSRFGSRLSWDLSGTFSGSWVANFVSELAVDNADQTGTANDPKLVVTYSPQGRNRVTLDQNRASAVAVFTNSASTTLAFSSAVTAGQLLTCCITGGSSAVNVSTITDSVNTAGKWKLAIRQRSTVTNSSLFSEIWYAVNSSGGTPTVTVALTSTAAGRFLFGIQSWSNADTSAGVLGAVHSTSGNSSNLTTPTLSSISSASVVLACWKTSAGITNRTNPSGWSTIAPQNSTRENTFYQLQTSTTPVSTKWQITAASQFVVAMAEFRGSTFTPSTVAGSGSASLPMVGVQ